MKKYLLLLIPIVFLSFVLNDNLYKLTGGQQKSWIFGHYLVNGYTIDDKFPCRTNSEVIFQANKTFKVDTTCAHSGSFSTPINFDIWENKMVLTNDTYDIVEFTDVTLRLQRLKIVKVKIDSLGSKQLDQKATFEVILYAK